MHFDDSSKLNNRGFSLIELLIAISILAIAIVPIMHGFISSIKLNSRTRGTLDTTMVAQDIIEGVKSESFDQLLEAFSTFSDDGTGTLDILPSDLIDANTRIKSKEFDGRLVVGVKDMVVRTDKGQQRYDAVITVDPEPYKTKKSEDDPRAYNAKGLSVVEKIDSTANAECLDNMKIQDIEQALPSIALSSLCRVITLDIELEESSNMYSVYMTTEYFENSVSGNPVLASYDITGGKQKTLYYQNDETELKNVYLFFFPGYELKSDTIVINNLDNLDVTAYLLKQKRGDIADSGAYTGYENEYKGETGKLHVDLYEAGLTDKNEPHLDICSNFAVNLCNDEAIATQKRNTFSYWKSGSAASEPWDFEQDPLKVVHQASSDRMYDVNVDMFGKSNDAAAIDIDAIEDFDTYEAWYSGWYEKLDKVEGIEKKNSISSSKLH